MASTSSTAFFISSSSAFVDAKAPRQTSAASPQCVTLPTLPPPPPSFQSHNRASKTTSYCRKISRNVRALATGEAPAEVAGTELPDVELPDVAKTIQEAWDKLDDKYAVTSLAVAVVVALWVSTGMISAIDRLPLVPGVLELVGIGYTGWFVYKNLIFKPEREELIEKIKNVYKDVIGTS